MKASYIKALETQAKWYAWGRKTIANNEEREPAVRESIINYTNVLETAETIYMNRNFCDLVDFARLTVPDELAFEEEWMMTPDGFLYLEEPFVVPNPTTMDDSLDLRTLGRELQMKIAAVSWSKRVTGGYYFMFYQNVAEYGGSRMEGFLPWSHVLINPGDRVLERLLSFEMFSNLRDKTGLYEQNREMELKHEIRWIFTALHLMSQRLAHISKERTSSLVRSLASNKKLKINPELKVVSLRRMEQERPGNERSVLWNWQWVVRGHWRLQPYKDGEHRWIFIEAYLKGPEDRPLKPMGRTIYNAVR